MKKPYKYEIRHCTEDGETVTKTFYSEFDDLTTEDDRCPFAIGSQEYITGVETEKCSNCNKDLIADENGCGTGYGLDKYNNKVCYACCAETDKQQMRDNGKICLYLTVKFNRKSKVSNWPGSLVWENVYVSIGKHNIARVRYDCWFWFENCEWHGVRYGDNTEIVHCKKTKVHRSINGQSEAQLTK